MKTSFSGHEKFECKTSWLPLAFANINEIYSDLEDAMTITGLGSNKIKSLRQWIQKFKLLEDRSLTESAEVIFSYDPFLENNDSLWILHVYLTQNYEKATLYYLFFNKFFLTTFTKDSFMQKIEKWCKDENLSISPNTLENDIVVFTKMYQQRDDKDQFSANIFQELNLLHKIDNEYIVNVKNPVQLSEKAFLYIFLYIIRNYENNTISVKDLQYGESSLQYILCLTEEKFLEKLESLSNLTNNQIVYQEASGLKQIYINQKLDLVKVLFDVYNKENI